MKTNRVLMSNLKREAREAAERGDKTAQWSHSQEWHERATEAEARRAPKYLIWTGRFTR